MAFKMKLHFTGLCAFSPKKPIDQGSNEATVVLVNARNSHHGTHRAVFFARSVHFSDENSRYITDPLIHNAVEMRACALDGEEFRLVGCDAHCRPLPLSADSLTFITGLRPNPPAPCPDDGSVSKDDTGDFSWVLLNPGILNPEVLTSLSLGELIATRLKLTVGSLLADGFRQYENKTVRWKFGGDDSQAIAEEVVWEFDFFDEVAGVMLMSTPFDGYDPKPHLILEPDTDSSLLEGFIVNMRPEDLLLLDPPRRLDPDDHFHEYYRLCQGTPPNTIPIPDTQIFCKGVAAASNPKCPPTYFASSTPAVALGGMSPASAPRKDGSTTRKEGHHP